MSPARGLYLARALKILSSLTAGCESTLHEKEPASGYNTVSFVLVVQQYFEEVAFASQSFVKHVMKFWQLKVKL